jgi:hypothetical protein
VQHYQQDRLHRMVLPAVHVRRHSTASYTGGAVLGNWSGVQQIS